MKYLTSLLLVVILGFSIEPTATNAEHSDNPNVEVLEYNAFNSPQRIFENQQLWLNYTTDAINEAAEATDRTLKTELYGHVLETTLGFMVAMEEAGYPSEPCTQEFYNTVKLVTQKYINTFSAVYYNLSSTVGHPVDAEVLFSALVEVEDWAYGEDNIPDNCWNKLD